MEPKNKVIQALKIASDRVLTEDYCWSSPATCNCGIFLQELLGISKEVLNKIIFEDNLHGTWTRRCGVDGSKTSALTTGNESRLVANICRTYGLVPRDFWRMEHIESPNMGVSCDERAVSRWLKNEAFRLEIELKQRQKNVKAQSVSVR